MVRAVRINGGTHFLKIIETEIKPKIAALVPVEVPTGSIRSFPGGLAVVHAFFTEPKAFLHMHRSSPSLEDGDADYEAKLPLPSLPDRPRRAAESPPAGTRRISSQRGP